MVRPGMLDIRQKVIFYILDDTYIYILIYIHIYTFLLVKVFSCLSLFVFVCLCLHRSMDWIVGVISIQKVCVLQSIRHDTKMSRL